MKANKVIYGNIYTVDKKKPKAAALAISDGKFVYVGDEPPQVCPVCKVPNRKFEKIGG